jgi:hypothetical protein
MVAVSLNEPQTIGPDSELASPRAYSNNDEGFPGSLIGFYMLPIATNARQEGQLLAVRHRRRCRVFDSSASQTT